MMYRLEDVRILYPKFVMKDCDIMLRPNMKSNKSP